MGLGFIDSFIHSLIHVVYVLKINHKICPCVHAGEQIHIIDTGAKK
jgi:hypothetical protein